MHTRRSFIKVLPSTAIALSLSSRVSLFGQVTSSEKVATLLAPGVLNETQYGEPGDTPEELSFQPSVAQKAFDSGKPYDLVKDPKKVALQMLTLSLAFAKESVSRNDSPPDQVREYLGLFGFELRYSDTTTYVPYCAAGVSYAACRAYCDTDPQFPYQPSTIGYNPKRISLFQSHLRDVKHHYFYPSPSVQVIVADAQDRGIWVGPKEDASPGWLVVFSWDGHKPNHIGIVSKNNSDILYTVEYNTTIIRNGNQRNGGIVAEKKRPRNASILGFVRTY